MDSTTPRTGEQPDGSWILDGDPPRWSTPKQKETRDGERDPTETPKSRRA